MEITAPPELILPTYNIYAYTDQIYKIVHFKGSRMASRLPVDPDKCKHYNSKLDASLSRARRVVLELALCNPWEYFATFTIDPAKWDRDDLPNFAKKFKQWIRDQRKKHDIDIPFVLVPEPHANGAWHMHGLFGDISSLLVSFRDLAASGVRVPSDLMKGDYYNWPDYQNKFGFCSFGKIRNKVACAFYVTKYITKSMGDSAVGVGMHLYYASAGLNRASFHGDVYGDCSYLDKFCVNHYDFCDTGMTHVNDGVSWDFALEYMDDIQPLEIFKAEDLDQEFVAEFETYFAAVQMAMEGFS